MNRTLSLIRYANVEGKGWRRGPVVLMKNGRLKSDAMMVGGVEVFAPNGRYKLRKYEGTSPIYVDLGNDPTDAMNRFKAEESKQRARNTAVAAGLELVTPEAEESRKTIRQYARDFLTMHRNLPHRSDDSLRVYTQVTSSFLAVCKATIPEEVTKEDVIRWHAELRKQYSARTASDRYTSLRGWLRYCGVDPDKLIPKGTNKLLSAYTQRKPNTYTPEQVQALIDASTDDNQALLWEFAYKTGLRDSELQMVTRYDLHGLDDDSPTLHVREREEYSRIKDAEERVIELHPGLVLKLKAWLKANPRKVLVFGTENDKPDGKMLKALKRAAVRAGIVCNRCDGCQRTGKDGKQCREFTLHRFRRTYTTRMLRATQGDLRSVMQRTGHSDITSVMRYLEPAAVIREAVAHAF